MYMHVVACVLRPQSPPEIIDQLLQSGVGNAIVWQFHEMRGISV